MPDVDVDSQLIINSSPVEKSHSAWYCAAGSFGVAVPTTFSVLDGNNDKMFKI